VRNPYGYQMEKCKHCLRMERRWNALGLGFSDPWYRSETGAKLHMAHYPLETDKTTRMPPHTFAACGVGWLVPPQEVRHDDAAS
jgi:hypothetical protein